MAKTLRIAASLALVASLWTAAAPAARAADATASKLIVKFKTSTTTLDRAVVESQTGLTLDRHLAGIDADVYWVTGASGTTDAVGGADAVSIAADRVTTAYGALIEYAEPDRLVSIAYVPNDEALATQWHHAKIGAPQAWDAARGDGVTIAVIDTGVDFTHPDLAASVIQGWNFQQNNADVSDFFGHGTNVAGIAAAIGDNGIGVAGVAYRSMILAIRMPATLELSLLAEGIVYAADQGARVANMSYGPACDSLTIADAASYLRARGGVLVVSAGNGAEVLLGDDLPFTCVAGTDQSDGYASYSTGPTVDVAAPSVAIYTTYRGGGYGYDSGTSFSAAIVSGVYAMMFSVNPALTPAQADQILFSNVKDLGKSGYDRQFGFGRVDAAAAVALAAVAGPPSTDVTGPTAPGGLAYASAGGDVTLSWTASADDVGVAHYMIYQGGYRVGSTAATSYTDALPDPSGIFTYAVRAFDAAGNGSPASTLRVQGPTYVAPAISRIRVSPAATTATVSWSTSKPASGVVSYRLASGGPVLTAAAPGLLTSQAATLTGLSKNTKYLYWITATDSWGGSATSAQATFTTARK